MATIASLVVQIGADIADLRTGVDQANTKIDSFASKATTAFRALTGAAAFGVVVNGLREIAAAADELDTLSGRIDDTAENVQRLQAVSESFDVEVSAIVAGIQTMQQKLGDGKLDDALKTLNIRVSDFRALTPSEQFVAAAEALAKIEDPATRGAAAAEIFGKNAKGLAGAFRDGVGDVDRWVKMSDDTVTAVDRVSTFFTKAKASVINFGAELIYSMSLMRGLDAIAKGLKWMDPKDGLTAPKSPLNSPLTLPTGLPDDYKSISDSLGKSATASIELQKNQKKIAEDAQRSAERFRETVGYFNTADDIGRTFLRSVEDSSEEISDIRTSMEAMAGISFHETWTPFAEGVADASREMADLFDNKLQRFKEEWAEFLGVLAIDVAYAIADGASASDVGGMIGGALGSYFGPLGSAFGQFYGSLIGNMFGSSRNQEVEQMRQRILSAAGGLEEFKARADAAGISIDRMLRANTVTEFQAAMQQLNEYFDEQVRLHNLALDAMERYGISIEQAGEKFKQSQMNQTAQSLLEDFEALLWAGVDIDLIIEKMGGSINDFVSRSIIMGTKVPREMEEIIRRMIEAGTLIDANGEKITDMSQIPFADNFNASLEKLIARIDVLIDRLTNGLGDAIRDIPPLPGDVTGGGGDSDSEERGKGGGGGGGERGGERNGRASIAVMPRAVVGFAAPVAGETHVHLHGGVFDGYASEQTFARRMLDVLSQEQERRGRSLAFAGA